MAETLAITEEAKKEVTPSLLPTKDDLIRYLKDCIHSGEEYRDKFKFTWEEIEEQIRLLPPAPWAKKEDWQTKTYIPSQAKASEGAFAKLKKMLFSGKFFDAVGVEKKDREKVSNLVALIYTLMDRGKFEVQNDQVLQEAVDAGSSFLKILVNSKGDGINFVWRSANNCFFDPECGSDFSKARWWIDEYIKDIGMLIQETLKPNSIYDKEAVEALIQDGVSQVTDKPEQGTLIIKSMDGTQSLRIPTAFKTVQFHEYWGLVKQPIKKKDDKGDWYDSDKYYYEWRVITMANEKHILRNNENKYDGIPVVMMRFKPLKYETYGRGFLDAGRGLQDLMNSMVNLGFDSLKLNSMDIIVMDESKVKDWDTIEYRPKAIWHMKDVSAVKFTRSGSGISALTDILRGINFLDSMHQDATGVMRQTQGSMPLSGQSGGAETLGEYKLKVQAIDERFLVQGKLVENTYMKALVGKIYQIMLNKDLFNQQTVDRILGTKEIEITEMVPNAITGALEPITRIDQVSKLVLSELDPEMEYDFRIISLTQMEELLILNQQIEKIMSIIVQYPMMARYLQPHALLKRLIQIMRVPDSEELLKSEEEVKREIEQEQSALQQQMRLQQPGGGGVAPAGPGVGAQPAPIR